MSKVLVDTNILVYGIDEDSAFFKRARKILEQDKYQLVTTSKNLIEFLAVTTKPSGYNLNNDIALEIVEEILQGIRHCLSDTGINGHLSRLYEPVSAQWTKSSRF